MRLKADFALCSGINRLTHNFELALPIIDDAFRCVYASCMPIPREMTVRANSA